MENLAEKITIFLAAHNYIAEDKKDWCHYVVIKFLMCYIPLYPLLNGEKPSAGVMLPGHDIELTIPYQILEMPWSTQEFAKLETERTQIVFSLYPVKKTIVLNEG